MVRRNKVDKKLFVRLITQYLGVKFEIQKWTTKREKRGRGEIGIFIRNLKYKIILLREKRGGREIDIFYLNKNLLLA